MESFTNKLTNGIWLPSYRLDKDEKDDTLLILLKYLLEFKDYSDIRVKIKSDFNLVKKFNEQK